MSFLNVFLAFLSVALWVGLIIVYNRHRFFPWLVNRFTRDKPPPAREENSLFGAPAALPFRYDMPASSHVTPSVECAEGVAHLYENEHYVVRVFKGSDRSRCCVASFHDLNSTDYFDGTFFGLDIARELDLPWISLVPKSDGCYREGDYATALRYVREWIAKRRNTLPEGNSFISYGTGMGGYAALKYSGDLGVDAVLALVPYWSLDPEERTSPSPVANHYHDFMAGMGIQRNDVTGTLFVACDPDIMKDWQEAELIQHHVSATLLPLFYGGHDLVPLIGSAKVLHAIFQHCQSPETVRIITAKARRHNPQVILHLIEHALARKRPDLAARTLRSQRAYESGALRILDEKDKDNARAIVQAMIVAGHGQDLARLLPHVGID